MFTIVGIGETLWDCFPDGARFGGAPANYACHAASLGAEAVLVSRVGDDDLGRRARKTLTEKGVNTDFLQTDPDAPSGAVQVEVDPRGKATFTFGTDEAWDQLAWSDALRELASQTDAVCFGTLGQRSETSRATIQRFVRATPDDAWRIFDINLRPPYFSKEVIAESLGIANALKLNDEELPRLAEMFNLPGEGTGLLRRILSEFGLRLIAVTRGDRGACLVRGEESSDRAGVETTVQDTVGAGDSFTATMTLGLLRGLELDAINDHACRVAAYVCSQSGATPALPESLRTFPE